AVLHEPVLAANLQMDRQKRRPVRRLRAAVERETEPRFGADVLREEALVGREDAHRAEGRAAVEVAAVALLRAAGVRRAVAVEAVEVRALRANVLAAQEAEVRREVQAHEVLLERAGGAASAAVV